MSGVAARGGGQPAETESAAAGSVPGGGGGPRLPAPVPFFGVPDAARTAAMKGAGPPPSLNAFLSAARRYATEPAALTAAQSACPSVDMLRVHVVLGNEAADMDSMVSSVVLAWYLSLLHPVATGNIFVPLIGVPRDQLCLRAESAFSFRQAGLDPALLLFLDDMEWAALKRRASLVAVLVDHNSLARELEPVLAPAVVAVLDHHHDAGLYPLTKVCDNRRIVVPVGSCTSLVADVIVRAAPWLLSAEAFPPEVDADPLAVPAPLAVVTLLYHVLLLDTQNLSATAGKAKELDEAMLAEYRARLQDLTYAELHRRRVDVSGLSTPQMLVKDVKYGDSAVYPYAICSVPGSLGDWCARDPKLLPHAEAFARGQRLRFVVLLTSFTDAKDRKYKREIVLLVPKDVPAGVAGAKGADAPVGAQPVADGSAASRDSERAASLCAPDSTALVERSPNVHTSGPPVDSDALLAALDGALMAAQEQLDCRPEPALLADAVRAQEHGLLVKSYAQQNVAGSRKQVSPVIEGAVSKL